MSSINFVFFGTSELSVKVLDILIKNGYVPDLVITVPDKPQGRKMIMTPPPVKVFALEHNLKIAQPHSLSTYHPASSAGELPPRLIGGQATTYHLLKIAQPNSLSTYNLPPNTYHLLIVASYGKIIPKSILEIPKFGTLNVHPSLLPKFRGPSPIQSFILSGEEKTGVTIMLMDDKIDHGAILAQQNLEIRNSKHEIRNKSEILNSKQLEEKLAELGGQMLVDVIPKWVKGEIKPTEQDHDQATFTKKITKEEGLVDLEKDNPETIYRKFLAFQPWPGIYYFTQKNDKKLRVIITDMELSANGELKIKKVKPEGRNEMRYDDFTK